MVNRGTYLMYLVVFLFIALAIVSVFLIICESRKHLCLARDVKAEFMHDMKKTNIKADYLDGVYNENKENINIVYNSKKLKTSFENMISDIECIESIISHKSGLGVGLGPLDPGKLPSNCIPKDGICGVDKMKLVGNCCSYLECKSIPTNKEETNYKICQPKTTPTPLPPSGFKPEPKPHYVPSNCFKTLKSVSKLEGDILLTLLMGIAKSIHELRPGGNVV
jgi:hypothetical protein